MTFTLYNMFCIVIALGSISYTSSNVLKWAQLLKTNSNDVYVKSFVDDLLMECGILSVKVASVIRSTEINP